MDAANACGQERGPEHNGTELETAGTKRALDQCHDGAEWAVLGLRTDHATPTRSSHQGGATAKAYINPARVTLS